MERLLVLILFMMAAVCSGCSGNNDSSQVQTQQTQIVALQSQLSAVQTQLSSATTQNTAYNGCLGSAITSLTQTQGILSQLLAQSVASPSSNVQKSPNALAAASNQVLVLQSIVASIATSTQNLTTAYATAQSSIATLTTQLTAANAQVTSLATQLSASQSSNSTLTSQLAAANTQVTTLTGQIATLNTAASSMQSQLNTANGTISTQAAAITTYVTTLTALQTQLSTGDYTQATLAAAITTLQNTAALVPGLQTINNTQAATLAALQTQLGAGDVSQATLTAAVTALQNSVTTLTSQLATANGTISTLNGTISTLNAQISAMVASPVQMSVSTLTAAVSTPITVTATFPSSENGKTATFTATGGNLLATPATVTIAGGAASTTFSSGSTGTFNIYAVDGLYAGGAIVTITATPPTTNTISGTITTSGSALSGVTVALTGTATNATVTDSSGNYSFAGLANGSYTITPTLAGYTPTTASLAVTVSSENVTGVDFNDVITSTYSCSGTLSTYGRWCDNGDGTVRDMTTGLVWLQNAACTTELDGITGGAMVWSNALIWLTYLENGSCGLSDGSSQGAWQLPSLLDLKSITQGTEAVLSGSPGPFSNVQSFMYWLSGSNVDGYPWFVIMGSGAVGFDVAGDYFYVWPVRSGPQGI